MIADTHLTLEEVATRATALGWMTRHEVFLGRRQLVVWRPGRLAYLIFSELSKVTQWRAISFASSADAVRLVREIEGREVVP